MTSLKRQQPCRLAALIFAKQDHLIPRCGRHVLITGAGTVWVLQDNNDHLIHPSACLCARQCLHFVAGLLYKNNKAVLEIEFASCSVCTHRQASAG